ncbi:hypothetical protein [Radiobacillus deserti]|nr:hypothetical protein [Radiobacillus deserti]
MKGEKNHKLQKREVLFDILSAIPELLVWPIRFFLWLLKAIGKMFDGL